MGYKTKSTGDEFHKWMLTRNKTLVYVGDVSQKERDNMISQEEANMTVSEISEPKVKFSDLQHVDGLILCDLSTEEFREYDFCGRTYRISNPVALYYREGGSTHRVIDKEGIVHCLPAPGNNGCVLKWRCGDNAPVAW